MPKPATAAPRRTKEQEAARQLQWKLVGRALDALYLPRRPKDIFPQGQKLQLYDIAAREIGDRPVTYLEFGVNKGWSLRQMVQRLKHPDSRFVGFDSFEGLPESWGGLKPGAFSTQGALPEIGDQRVSFVKGWFQETVHRFLSGRRFSGPVLIHFDADLYSSTLFLMSTIWHHISEYYFIFDEYTPSEIMAMYDFSQAYPIEIELFAATENTLDLPLQVLGRLKNGAVRAAAG